MATYMLEIMHGKRDSEGEYPFEGPDDMMSHSPITVMRTAMQAIEADAGIGHIDYELNAAMKNKEKGVVTALGNLVFHGNDHQPFVCFISAA